VQAFDFEPQSAIAGRIGGIGGFRDDALELQFTGLLVERRALSAVVIAVVQGRRDPRQQFGEPRLALDQRPRAEVVAVELQKVEDEVGQTGRVAGVRCGLDHAEQGDAVGEDAAQFAVEIGLARAERRDGRGESAGIYGSRFASSAARRRGRAVHACGSRRT
jgi:hypothetical protein